jgi:glycosyltransferase involved in cell wall biosynthesis
MRSFSVIMPVYNEGETLDAGVKEVLAALDQLPECVYELIIIESGSTDGTGQSADELARTCPQVRVIHEGRRNGFGAAVRLGYQAATMDWIWLVTPDIPFPLTALRDALPLLDRDNAIISYRVHDDRGWMRKLQSLIFNTLVRAAFGLRFRHINSAFKILPREFAQGIELRSRGWTVDAEIAWHLKQQGVRVTEIPVPLIDRTGGASKIGAGTGLRVFKELIWLWRIRHTLVFHPCGPSGSRHNR